MRLSVVLAACLAFATGALAEDEAYDESRLASDALRDALEAQDRESAFRALKPSELSASSHRADLIVLAGMYEDHEFPGLGTRRERALKFWELSERAALAGFEPAVIQLINAFWWGDETLGYDSNEVVADCLDGISDQRAYVSPGKEWLDTTMVSECLSLRSSATARDADS